MKKQKILAFILSVTMIVTSCSFNLYANESSALLTGNNKNIATSSSAIEINTEETTDEIQQDFSFIKTKAPWKASVFGNYEQSQVELKDIFTVDDSVNEVVNIGAVNNSKLKSSLSSNMALYYQEINSNDDFRLSAKAEIKSINPQNNNSSFGLIISDNIISNGDYQNIIPFSNYIYVGPSGINKNNISKASYSINKTLYNALNDEELSMESSNIPKNGDVIDISIEKIQNTYKLVYGNENPIIKEISFSENIFVGLFSANDAIVSYSNVKIEKDFQAKESDWIQGWTGTKTDKYKITANNEDSVTLELTANGTGKLSNNEDSILYYVKELPVNTDFELSATVTIDKYNSYGSSNPNQTSVGLMILDELYSREQDKTKVFSNSVMTMSYAEGSKATKAQIRGAYRNGTVRTVDTTPLSEEFSIQGENLGSFPLKIIKSGNVYVMSCGDEKFTYTDDSLFKASIYPGFFAARDAKATFSDIKLNIDSKKISKIEVAKLPDKTNYIINDKLDLTGIKVLATFSDGSIEEITDYVVSEFDSSTSGKKTVKVSKGSAETTFEINVSALTCSEIKVEYEPIKTEYYIGSKLLLSGISIYASYIDGNSSELERNQYILSIDGKVIDENTRFTEEFTGEKEVKVTHISNDTISSGDAFDTFKIIVYPYKLESIRIASVPQKLSYYINDKIASAGLKVEAKYVSKDGKIQQDVLEKSDYTIEEIDTSKAGKYAVKVISAIDSSKIDSFEISVAERKIYKFDITKFPKTTYYIGEQFDKSDMIVSYNFNSGEIVPTNEYTIDLSQYDSSKTGTTKVIIIPNDKSILPIELPITIIESKDYKWRKIIFGQSSSISKCSVNVEPLDTYGTLNFDNLNISSLEGAGKVTGDHDGIAYYYTRVNPNNNFTLTADVKINRYLEHDNDDTRRNGQEAFGLMARDVIPFEGKDGQMTISKDEAKIDNEGEPIGLNSSAVFASNMVIAGGYSGNAWPNDPTSPTYDKNTKINRINLLARKGVYETDGGGEKLGPNAVSSDFPKEGNKYRITLSKVNGGVYAKCFDYQTNETKETYIYEKERLFDLQNSEDAYIGFFTARWADIDITNAQFHESNPVTDKFEYVKQEEIQTPNITVLSKLYSQDVNYLLSIKADNTLGGIITIKQNGNIIYKGSNVYNSATVFKTELKANAKNNFEILYQPNDSDLITSTDDVIKRFSVIHREFDTKLETVYVSVNGKVDGDGTKEKPYDIDTAIGFIDAGQTIIMLEGVYPRTTGIEIPLGNNGTKNKMKRIFAEEGKDVIFDMQNISDGMTLTGNYWHIKGINFINSGENLKAFGLGGSNCIVEDCKFYNNGDIGMQISRTYPTNNFNEWPSNNLVLNCESFNNCDPSMINADGFGAKLTVGNGNVFRNCIAHHNVDDGWDLYTKLATGPIGSVTLENCISYKQGYRLLEDGSEVLYGAGGHNGFKMGGENIAVQHVLKDCIAFDNGGNGVSSNSNPAMKIRNVVAYNNASESDNKGSNFGLYSDKPERYNYDLKGLVSYDCKNSDKIGTFNYHEKYTNASSTVINSETNYVLLESARSPVNSKGEKVDDSFFKSLDRTGVLVKGRYKQNADGTFITGDFLKRTVGFIHDKEEETTTTEEVTETTTEAYGGGSSGGSSGSSSSKKVSNNTNEFIQSKEIIKEIYFTSDDLKNANQVLKIEDKSSNVFKINLPSSKDNIQLNVNGILIQIPQKIEEIKSDNFTIVLKNTETLPIPVQKAAKNTVKISIFDGDKEIKNLQEAILITFPYEHLTDESYKVVGVYLDDSGKTSIIKNSLYHNGSEINGVLTFADKTGIIGIILNDVFFEDIQKTWAQTYIETLAAREIINGVSQNKFNPVSKITAGDFIKMLVDIFDDTDINSSKTVSKPNDIEESDYYYKQVMVAKQLGFLDGLDEKTFKIKESISRQDMMVILFNALEYMDSDIINLQEEANLNFHQFDDTDEISNYALNSIQKLVSLGIIRGSNGSLNPKENLTRAEAARILYEIWNLY